jgi:DnaJ-class molecular chaperone
MDSSEMIATLALDFVLTYGTKPCRTCQGSTMARSATTGKVTYCWDCDGLGRLITPDSIGHLLARIMDAAKMTQVTQ